MHRKMQNKWSIIILQRSFQKSKKEIHRMQDDRMKIYPIPKLECEKEKRGGEKRKRKYKKKCRGMRRWPIISTFLFGGLEIRG